MMQTVFLFCFTLLYLQSIGQVKSRNNKLPVINYTLSVDSVMFSFFSVEMKMKNMPDHFSVALFAHPEYDDQYWRFIEDLTIE
ncbi:MAG: hypothetical protein JWN76_1344 [Chitinophagaceae bacterium]|nr:hypothetical protein [Chitinophagaceae bacterium]